MNKYIILILTSIIIFSCKSRQKIETIQKAIETKDTAKPVIIKHVEAIDSVAIIKSLVKNIVSKKIDYKTFNAKIKVEYIGQEETQNAVAYVSILKDSVIYIKLKVSALGILAMEAKITKDSVTLVKLVQGSYVQKRSINYLQEITQIPFTYHTLQDLLVGNQVFVDTNNITSYRITNNNQLTVITIGSIFKNLLSINNENNTITHCKLDDIDVNRNRTCDITYSNFSIIKNIPFSTYRSISVAEKSRLDINLDIKEFNFDEPIKYSFEVPKKLKNK